MVLVQKMQPFPSSVPWADHGVSGGYITGRYRDKRAVPHIVNIELFTSTVAASGVYHSAHSVLARTLP